MKVRTNNPSTRWRSSWFYLVIAVLIICIAISEVYLSRVFVVHVPTDNNAKSILNNFRKTEVVGRKLSKIARVQRSVPSKNPKLEVDAVCPYCRFSYINQKRSTLTCGKKITTDRNLNLNTSNIESSPSFREVAISVARMNSTNGSCRRCDPASCSAKDKVYYRMDDVSPREVSATTYYLQSIPTKHRIPRSELKNLTAYFSDKANVHPARQYFFEFNPSIVQLPKSQRIVPDAMYLASFRVSTCHDCVPNPNDYIKMMNGPRSSVSHTEYLGLAILNRYLKIVQEIVVKVQPLILRFQDPRLFVLNEQLYVGSYHHIRPLWLTSKGVDGNIMASLTHVWPDTELTKNRIISEIFLGKHGTSICTKDMKAKAKAKNLNYFVDSNNDTILELIPMGPYERMNMSEFCVTKATTEATFIQDNSTVPYPSFGTTDELDLARQKYYDAYVTDERGSACCTTINHPDGRPLRLGISHSKTLFWNGQVKPVKSNQFFSSFYAFEPDPPYKVVARTGRFCFGFPKESEDENPYTKMQVDTIKIIKAEYKNCPRIHFVSGMVEKADDPTKLIVTYGVNDCVPRMVVIKKSDVARMLFAPHEMLDSGTLSRIQL